MIRRKKQQTGGASAAVQVRERGGHPFTALRRYTPLGGADNVMPDTEVPMRQLLEQLVAKTGLPPFLLELSWSSTERMSSQQADMLTSEITALRRSLTPMMDRVCRLWLRMHGYGCRFHVEWDDINLQDLVEENKAELYREQARKLRLENDRMEERK